MAKLLVVEDDRMFAELIRHALREEGHLVDVASDCAEARATTSEHAYDGILLDVSLPSSSSTPSRSSRAASCWRRCGT